MSFFASVAGYQVVGGALMVPLVGMWTADLYLATANPVSGTVAIVIGNLTLKGTVFRSNAYGGQTRVRLVAGYGGWREAISSQGYGNSSGVKLSTVLGDVASACGEQVNVAADATIGNAYTRADSLASDALWQMLAQGFIPSWYIDSNGVTQVAAWPSSAIQTTFTVVDQKPDEGLVIVATEDYASWMPGATFTNPLVNGSFTVAGVNYVWGNDGQFRFEVLTGTTDRFLGALASFVQRQIAPTRFYGRYEYTISNPSLTTVDATPTDGSIGLPELQNVPICSDSVATYTPPDGGTCHIEFLNGVPTKPICVWTDQTPTIANLLSGSNPVARLGDQVQSFLPPTLLLVGTSAVMGAFTANATIVNPITGTITEGSPTVNTD